MMLKSLVTAHEMQAGITSDIMVLEEVALHITFPPKVTISYKRK